MAAVRLYSDKVINRIVSRLPEAQDAVKRGSRRDRPASRGLAARRKTGDVRATVDHSGTDSVVHLDDERGKGAALSIEYGHATEDGTYVEGLYILHLAAGLA